MKFPTAINWISLFPFKGFLVDNFHLFLNCNTTFCKQTGETLSRYHISGACPGSALLYMSHIKVAKFIWAKNTQLIVRFYSTP